MASAHQQQRSPLESLWHFLRTERETIWIIIVYACGVGLLSLALPVAIQSLVNTVAFGTVFQPIVVLTLIVSVFLAASSVLRVFQTVVSEVLQRRIFVRFSMLIASRLPNLRPETHRAVNVQETVNRFFDIFLVQKALAFLLLEGVGLFLQAAIGLILLAFYHPFLLAFGLFLIGAMIFVSRVLGKGAIETALDESSAKYAMAAWLEDMAKVPRTLNSRVGNRQALERADQMAAVWLNAREGHFNKIFAQTIGTLSLQVLASVTLLGFGGWLVIRKELSLGQLVAAELIVTGVLYSISKMGKQFEAFYDVVAGFEKLEGILRLPVMEGGGRSLENGEAPWRIEFQDVTFKEKKSSRQISIESLVIPSGSRVLIQGTGGSGKSLLAELFLGLTRPDSGRVFIQDQDLRYLDANDLHDRSRLIQDLELIDATIEENLLLGVGKASLAEIEWALKAVFLDQTISVLRDGLATRVNNRGAPLTYTQARRLMLARAILSKPSLLVLDKNSDWLHSPIPGCSVEQFLRHLFDTLSSCTVIVLAEPEFVTPSMAKEFSLCFELKEGGLHHA